jgi:hypothetical protein
MNSYKSRVRAAFSPSDRRLVEKLSTPQKIQDYLDTIKINFGGGKIVVHSPTWVMKHRRASCIEGALFAAASLAYHGREPLLMDLRAAPYDEDHVVALFKEKGYWGAMSKTNHPVLRWRDPVYKTPRELAMSYFHEYFFPDAGARQRVKTMRAYSAPFSLTRFDPQLWVGATDDLDWLAVALDGSRHFPAAPAHARVRKASKIELKAARLSEW